MPLGPGELILIGFVLVVVFSASRMGALGNAVGKFVYSFKRAARGNDLIDVQGRRVDPPSPGSDLKRSDPEP
jgi:sec-independent protein translocase protein TatA